MGRAARRVLVVSEDPMLRVAFARVLDLYDVRTADAARALQTLRAGDFAAIVYDVGAGRIEALAFVDALTEIERSRLLVVDAVHYRDELARRVSDRRVAKPISAGELQAVIALLTTRNFA